MPRSLAIYGILLKFMNSSVTFGANNFKFLIVQNTFLKNFK